MARGRKIKWIDRHENPDGSCFYFASIGTGRRNYIRTLGICNDPEVEEFVRLWREKVVTHEADIEERLMQPVYAGPPPYGEAQTASPVEIERELDMARNMFGKLRPEYKTRLRAVLYQPTEQTWDDAYSIIVGADGWMTLWKAVITVDPTFPRTGPSSDARGRQTSRWAKVPSQETLIKALRYATH